MSRDSLALANATAVDGADAAQWRALVEKTLKGASPDSLTAYSRDGLPTLALYTHAEGQPDAVRFGQVRSQGRGRWDVRSVVAHPDLATANAQALQDLENGANSLLLRLDGAGADGIAVRAAGDLARVLAGVELELAPVALEAGWLGLEAADWLHAVARSAPRAQLALHLDPLGAFARSGESPGPIETQLGQAASLATRLHEAYPAMTGFLASGQVLHEAGGTEAQELAMALSAALAYLRALDSAGLAPTAAAGLVVLGLAADAEYFTTLAKHRAARALWIRLTRALGVAAPARIEARSSRRMLSKLDAWVNLLRLTAAGFGAAVGGADALVLEPFTAPLGAPTDFARRQARNAQLVLMEESGLGWVEDAAGGCWFLEAQTDQLARAAWALFQQLERMGGLAEALKAGLIAEWATAGRAALAEEVASGARKLIGTSVFRNPDEAPVAVETLAPADLNPPPRAARAPGEDSHCPPLMGWRVSQAYEEGGPARQPERRS